MSDAILSVGFACKLRLHTYVTRAGMLCGWAKLKNDKIVKNVKLRARLMLWYVRTLLHTCLHLFPNLGVGVDESVLLLSSARSTKISAKGNRPKRSFIKLTPGSGHPLICERKLALSSCFWCC
jgi:hypothetical protein